MVTIGVLEDMSLEKCYRDGLPSVHGGVLCSCEDLSECRAQIVDE